MNIDSFPLAVSTNAVPNLKGHMNVVALGVEGTGWGCPCAEYGDTLNVTATKKIMAQKRQNIWTPENAIIHAENSR
jgi:hypothetical protein